MNGSPSVKVALFIRNGGSESPCRWFYVTGIYIPDGRDRSFGIKDCYSISPSLQSIKPSDIKINLIHCRKTIIGKAKKVAAL